MNIRKFVLGGTAVMLLLGGTGEPLLVNASSSAKPSAAVESGSLASGREATQVYIVDVTNLRSGPGLEFDVIAKGQKGDTFAIESAEGDWYRVALPNGGNAYVANWVVRTDAAPAMQERPAAPAAPDKIHIVAVTNIRSGPGLHFDVVAKAKSGDTYRIDGSEGEWYRITLAGGAKAYVAKWVVRTSEVADSDSKVYIYHSHNRESWKSVARSTNGSSYDDRTTNITLVGKRLSELLGQKGVPTVFEEADFAARLSEQKLSYSQSYAESGKAVANALHSYRSLEYLFDIHRDGDLARSVTTVTIGKTSYARIMFVIGTANPNYRENKKLADSLHAALNKKYPGISRGVLLKSAQKGNGEYNQSYSGGSLLLEVGGVNNTLEESLNAAAAFADVFAEFLEASEAR